MDLEGKRIGRFLVGRLIGSGGMGEVYEATDTFLGRTVALKVLLTLTSDFNDALERFFREAKAVARMEHRNIVRIYEADDNPECPFIAMELIRGRDGRAVLSERPGLAKVLDLMSQVFDGLHHAHQAGVVHRDVKPANLLVTEDGTVKLIDFGLARLTDDQRDLTRGQVFGSAPYMSPEQIMDPATVDYRTDIYMGGVLLYQLITGDLPFHGPTVADTLTAIVRNPPPDVLARAPHAPPELAEIILRCLSKKRTERPQSAGEVARLLQAIRSSLSDPHRGELTIHATVFPNSPGTSPASWGPLEVAPPSPHPLSTGAVAPAPSRSYPRPSPDPVRIPEGDDGLVSFELTQEVPVEIPAALSRPLHPVPRSVSHNPVLIGVLAGIVLLAIFISGIFVARRISSHSDSPQQPTPAPAPTQTAPVTATLQLAPVTPAAGILRMRIKAGENYEFRVAAAGAVSPQATLQWRLNDDSVATGSFFVYYAARAGFSDLVSVTYSDPSLNQTKTLIWYVNVD